MVDNAEFALLLAAREYHPDPEVREQVRDLLGAYIGAAARQGVVDAVLAERGTVLEPFMVEDLDARLAADLMPLAERAGTGMRIVSRDKLVRQGGLHLDQIDDGGRPRSRYVECVADRATSTIGEPEPLWLGPGLLPEFVRTPAELGRPKAQAVADDHGLRVRVGPYPWQALRGAAPNAYGSSFMGSGKPVSSMGGDVRIERSDEGAWITLAARTPEDTIRLTALMADNEWVLLQLPETLTGYGRVAVRMDLPDGASRDLLCVPVFGDTARGALGEWLTLPSRLDDLPVVDEHIRRALAAWTGALPQWIKPALMKQYA